MSRIHEVLEILERDRPAAAAPRSPDSAPPARPRATLDHYPRERRVANVLERQDHGRDQKVVAPSLPESVSGDGHGKSNGARARGRLIGHDSPAAELEQYRRLAAALHDAQMARGIKTVMVTSALPREGKTLTALNLAITLSESYGRQVLLIDADLRWPSIHHVLGLPKTRGLSEALRSESLELPFVPMSPHWSVLLAGVPGPMPLAGLTSERMGVLLDEFENRFDWVLLDTPPVGFLPDARLLARLIQSVVLVIGAGATPAAIVERAVAELGPDSILGTVLNRVREDDMPAAGYYYKASEAAASAP
jgi:capsular exopolysaccharide synthesis family protein